MSIWRALKTLSTIFSKLAGSAGRRAGLTFEAPEGLVLLIERWHTFTIPSKIPFMMESTRSASAGTFSARYC